MTETTEPIVWRIGDRISPKHDDGVGIVCDIHTVKAGARPRLGVRWFSDPHDDTPFAEVPISVVVDDGGYHRFPGVSSDSLEALAHSVVEALKIEGALGTVYGAVRDAFDMGIEITQRAQEATQKADRTSFGKPADPTKREGFVLNAVHTIAPEQIATYGAELTLMAWIQQTVRELSANGADPLRDLSLQIVGMPDGTVVVTGEAGV